MSMPILQLGQCGNQIGANFYDIMFDQALRSSHAHQSLIQQFFYQNQKKQFKAKALQIDMEPKVVQKNLAMKKNWGYSKKLSLVEEQGSGNNWAYGCLVHGQKMKQKLQNLLSNFVEGQDYIKAFTQIQSMAGGTGSGLGTYICELMDQMFPKTPKFAICIMPHLSGEVILQSYNSCLSLSTMYNTSDGIFIVQNDDINSICTKQLKINKISLEDINQVIGRNLASVFFPVVNKNTSKLFSIQQNEFNYGVDLIQNIFCDSRFKLASIKTSPNGAKNTQGFNSDSWQAIENELTKKKYYKIKNQMFIVRGSDHQNSIKAKQYTLFDKHNFYKYPRSMSAIENSQKFNQSLNKLLDRGYNMFINNAYVHQYYKYGLQKDKFLESFSSIQNIILNYSKI